MIDGNTFACILGAITDPGQDTVSQFIVHWGDGTSDTYTTAGEKTHVFASGTATRSITVDLMDEDGTYTGVASKRRLRQPRRPGPFDQWRSASRIGRLGLYARAPEQRRNLPATSAAG